MRGHAVPHVWRAHHLNVAGAVEGMTFFKDALSVLALVAIAFPLLWLWDFNQKRERDYRKLRSRIRKGLARWRGARATLRDARRRDGVKR